MSKKGKLFSVAIVLLVTMAAIAQRPIYGNEEQPASFQQGYHFYHNLSAERVAELHAKKMQLALDLSKNEYDNVYSIALKFNEEMRVAKKKVKTEPGKPSPETIYKMQLKRIELLQVVKQELRAFLTKEQIEKWEIIMMKH